MRFSLKWLLAATLYVAIATAAFGRGEWYYADALWALTFLAVSYAAALSMIARGQRWAMAAGFFCASVAFLTVLATDDKKGPVVRVFDAFEINPSYFEDPTPIYLGSRWMPMATPATIARFRCYVRAANAVATMAFGLMGSLVGLLAYRAAKNSADGPFR